MKTMADQDDNQKKEKTTKQPVKPEAQQLPVNTSQHTQDNEHVKEIMESLQMMAFQEGKSGSFDFDKLSRDQVDKILDTVDKNEDNAFKYNMRRLEVFENLSGKSISASTITQITIRWWGTIGLILFVAITFYILIYKDDFLMTWFAFIIGIFGGVGLKDPLSKFFKGVKPDIHIPNEDEE